MVGVVVALVIGAAFVCGLTAMVCFALGRLLAEINRPAAVVLCGALAPLGIGAWGALQPVLHPPTGRFIAEGPGLYEFIAISVSLAALPFSLFLSHRLLPRRSR